MTRILPAVISLLFLSLSGIAQTSKSTLTPGAQLLFQNAKSKLTPAEKNQIFQKLGFVLSTDKKQFVADASSMDFPFAATVFPTDLNKDGKEEIFVSYGNTYTSGNAGSSIVLFIKNSAGVYQPHLGFPGLVPDALSTASGGYPDLLIPGPGLDYPVLRWNGKTYDNHRIIKDQNYEATKKTNIEAVSKTYTANLPG